MDLVVWVTGASSGIGAALARVWARQGAQVVVSARREDKLRELVEQLEGGPNRHLVLPLDLSKAEFFPAAVAAVEGRFGRVDVLINNGGLGQRGFAAETSLEVDRRIMEVNYFGQVGLTKAVLPGMLQRRAGHIVAMSSVVGYVATPRRSAYAASKHALQGFFNALRAEVHRKGVHVSVVCPGYVRTEISLHALDSIGGQHAKLDSAQAKAMSSDEFAAKLLPALIAKKREILIGGPECFSVYLQRWFPALVARILRNKKFC